MPLFLFDPGCLAFETKLKQKSSSNRPLKPKKTAWAASFLIALQLLMPISSYAQLPTMGDGADMSASAERRIGDNIARQIYRDPDYTDDPVLMDYVRGIWSRLMQAARLRGELSTELEEAFAWDVVLDRDRSVNAFALPGGYMGVNLGLLAVVTSEDELASVMAHELSHITQRHIARLTGQSSKQGPLLIAAMILGALAASRNPQAGTAMIAGGQAVAIQGQLNFSRDMEREADRVGYGVLTQADFAPEGFVTMFEKLQQANRFNDLGGFPYLRSHPMTTARIADMQARLQLLPPTISSPAVAHALLAMRAYVLSHADTESLRTTVSQAGSPQLAQLTLTRQAAVLYGAALAASMQRDFALANRLWDRLHALSRDMVPVQAQVIRLVRLLGAELALASGNPALALERLASGPSSASTGAVLRPELFLWSQAMTLSGKAEQASGVAQKLQTWVVNWPRDAQAWQLLSVAYVAQGQPLSAIRADAEGRAAQLDFAAALNRLKAAQDMMRQGGRIDHIEASIIDTRAREFELRLREQTLQR
jgi:predicted Zn-dependent protease